MKEIRRSHTATAHAFTPSYALRVLHCMENAAAKFIRVMGAQHKNMLCATMYCIVLSLSYISFVSCDIAPNAEKNRFTDDEQIGANILPVSAVCVPFSFVSFLFVPLSLSLSLSEINWDSPNCFLAQYWNSQQNPLKHALNDDQKPSLNTDNISKSTTAALGDVSFLHAFITSLSVIVVSELGDKTFFIAAIMAMRHPRAIVFAGAISALALMTVLSGEPHCIP